MDRIEVEIDKTDIEMNKTDVEMDKTEIQMDKNRSRIESCFLFALFCIFSLSRPGFQYKNMMIECQY